MKLSKKTAKLLATIAGAVALGAGVMTTTANADTTYTVQSGDTLSGIVQKFGLGNDAIDSIATANHLANKNLIYVGEQLTITDNGQIVAQNGQTLASTTNGAASQNGSANTAATNNQTATTNNTNNNVSTNANNNTSANVVSNGSSVAKTGATASTGTSNTALVVNGAADGASTAYTSSVSGNDAAAKAWIAAHESGGSYSAVNGQYIGKYQLSASYLNGDYSPANQERVADNYVASRYGSWTAAQAFWQSHGWY